MATIPPHPLGPRTASCQALTCDRTLSVPVPESESFQCRVSGWIGSLFPGPRHLSIHQGAWLSFFFKEYFIRQITYAFLTRVLISQKLKQIMPCLG